MKKEEYRLVTNEEAEIVLLRYTLMNSIQFCEVVCPKNWLCKQVDSHTRLPLITITVQTEISVQYLKNEVNLSFKSECTDVSTFVSLAFDTLNLELGVFSIGKILIQSSSTLS